MTETFYLKVDITSDEDLEYYEDRDDGEYVEVIPKLGEREKFNSQIEKAVKKALLKDVGIIDTALEYDENFGIIKNEAVDSVVAKFYDPESDITAIGEFLEPEIKFSVARGIKKS